MTTVTRFEGIKFSSILKVSHFVQNLESIKQYSLKSLSSSLSISQARLYCPKNSYESPSDLLYCCDILLLSSTCMKIST